MDAFQLIASVISSIAWPAVALIFLYFSRSHIPSLVRRLEEFSYPGGKAKFEKQIEIASEIAGQVQIEPPISAEESNENQKIILDTASDHNEFIKFAALYPAAAIFQSFKVIEDVYTEFFKLGQVSQSEVQSLITELSNGRFLEMPYANLYTALRKIRNNAVHSNSEEWNVESVVNFRSMCEQLAERLRYALGKKYPTFKPEDK